MGKVDIFKTPHMTASGQGLKRTNPKGYVPALLDDGAWLSEGAAIVQYLADLNPDAGLAPPAGTLNRYRLQSWLNFIAAVHKMYSPWLFHAEYGMAVQQIARDKIAQCLTWLRSNLPGEARS